MTAHQTAELFPADVLRPSRSSHRATGSIGVFDANRSRPIHRWYPFVEGYSDELVAGILDAVGGDSDVGLLDPFGGSGTTALAAAQRGHDSMFCEVNPYLAWVADVKINLTREASTSGRLDDLLRLADKIELRLQPGTSRHPLVHADQRRRFFPPGNSRIIVGLLERIDAELSGPVRELARLAVATSLIPTSNMIRRTDLRRRHDGDPAPLPFASTVAQQLRIVHQDVRKAGPALAGRAVQVASDARELAGTPTPVTLVVTSPPYLNGTNYCRNTKLELLALSFIEEEQELAKLRLESITAGINNVSKRRSEPDMLPAVEEIAAKLDTVAYDQRIPKLVRLYFSDMKSVFHSVRAVATSEARFHLDIGDSRFAAVHVPTPALLAEVAATEGWRLESSQVLRTRRSYDGTALEQALLEFHAVPVI